ncbi:MAG: guanylate kinase [Candidatus Dormibacteria bacterium]
MTGGAGRLIVLSGPSGVGKDTVIPELMRIRPTLRRPVAYTTRAPRAGEVDGRDYTFVDGDRFQEMEAEGDFLETATVHGHRYGTSKRRVGQLLQVGAEVLLKPDVQGAARLRDLGLVDVFIFLAPPSEEELRERLEARRTEDPGDLETRRRDSVAELREAGWYQHVVVNDQVARAALEIDRILSTGRAPAA